MKFTWYTRRLGKRTFNENAQALEQAVMLDSYWLMRWRKQDKNLQIVMGMVFDDNNVDKNELKQ